MSYNIVELEKFMFAIKIVKIDPTFPYFLSNSLKIANFPRFVNCNREPVWSKFSLEMRSSAGNSITYMVLTK